MKFILKLIIITALPAFNKALADFDQLLDCSIKKLALEFSQSVLDSSLSTELVFDALELGSVCGETFSPPEAKSKSNEAFLKSLANADVTVVVDAASGSDSPNQTGPYQTISGALDYLKDKPDDFSKVIHLNPGESAGRSSRDATK